MSIELTIACLSIQGLSQPEKHILTVLCFRANQQYEVYLTILRLSSECSCSIKTVERTLKKLRDNGLLIYTGKVAPKSKNIPIYRINLNHGLSVGGKYLTTDSQSSNHGLSVLLTTPSEGIRIDHNIKDNRKDNGSFSNFEISKFTELKNDLKARGIKFNLTIHQWDDFGQLNLNDYLIQNQQN